MTEDDVVEIMRDIDKNADDRISFEEFLLISDSELVRGKELSAFETFFKETYQGVFGDGDMSYWTTFVTKTLRRRAQVEAEIALRRLFREKRPPSPYCVLACGLADDIEDLRPEVETSTWRAVLEYMGRILEPAGLAGDGDDRDGGDGAEKGEGKGKAAGEGEDMEAQGGGDKA